MKTQIETLSRRRVIVVTVLGLTYLFSQFFSLEFIAEWTGWEKTTLEILENIGFAAFVLAILAFALIYRRVQHMGDHAKTELHDELVRHNFHQSMIFGFKIIFVLAFILFGLCQFVDLIGEDVARIFLTVGLAIPYLRFAYLENSNA